MRAHNRSATFFCALHRHCAAHAALDTAVRIAYGFSAKKELLAQLLALNQQVAAKIEKKEPVMAPGVTKNYPDAKKLVTEDCIKPAPSPEDGADRRIGQVRRFSS